MAIEFLPSELLKKLAPEKLINKLVRSNLTINRATLTMLSKSGVLKKKTLEDVALRVLRTYKDRYSEARDEGETKSDAFDLATGDNALMVQRIQNASVNEIANEIKDQYDGEYYEWLPSDAETPDPVHQLNYGKTFQVGVGDDNGEDPGDRYGCRCGMRILVDQTELEL